MNSPRLPSRPAIRTHGFNMIAGSPVRAGSNAPSEDQYSRCRLASKAMPSGSGGTASVCDVASNDTRDCHVPPRQHEWIAGGARPAPMNVAHQASDVMTWRDGHWQVAERYDDVLRPRAVESRVAPLGRNSYQSRISVQFRSESLGLPEPGEGLVRCR